MGFIRLPAGRLDESSKQNLRFCRILQNACSEPVWNSWQRFIRNLGKHLIRLPAGRPDETTQNCRRRCSLQNSSSGLSATRTGNAGHTLQNRPAQEILGANGSAENGPLDPAARGAAGSPWTTRRRLLHLTIPETLCFLARRELPVAAGKTGEGPQESGGGGLC